MLRTKINHILDVLDSCETPTQLEYAHKWAVFVANKHKLSCILLRPIEMIYECKKKFMEAINDISC